MQKDVEETDPFKRSGKIARSPLGAAGTVAAAAGTVVRAESDSDTEQGSKKRKERSGKTPEKSREKRSRKSPAEGASLDITESESGDVSGGVVLEQCLGGGDVGEVWAVTSEIKHWLLNQFKSKKISLVSYDEITKKLRTIRQLACEMVKKNAKLESRLEERIRIETMIDKKMVDVQVI